MNNTYSLLVFHMLPEETKVYLIPNDAITADMRGWFTEAQNKFINSDEMNDGMRFLNTALCDTDLGIAAEEGFEEYAGCFVECRVSNETALTPMNLDGGTITHVYLSGLCL